MAGKPKKYEGIFADEVGDVYLASELMARRDLTAGDKVLFGILTHLLGIGVCKGLDPRWPSIKVLAKATGSTPKTTKRRIARLVKAGAIRGWTE